MTFPAPIFMKLTNSLWQTFWQTGDHQHCTSSRYWSLFSCHFLSVL